MAAMSLSGRQMRLVSGAGRAGPTGPMGLLNSYATPRILRTSSAPSSPTAAATPYSTR